MRRDNLLRVLVVEDEAIERQAIVLTLRNHFPNINVIAEAGNGYDALVRFRECEPDLVLMDVSIPGINGLQTIQMMNAESPGTSFIILSSHDNFAYAQWAIQLGVEDYLLKPANIDALQRSIQSIEQKRALEQDKKRKATALQERVNKIRPIVINDFIISIISNGDPDVFKQTFSFLGFDIMTGFCMLLTENNGFRRTMSIVENALTEVGYKLICGFYDNHSVYCVLVESATEKMIDEVLQYTSLLLHNNGYKNFTLAASNSIDNVEHWSRGYQQASAAIRHAIKENLQIKKFEEQLSSAEENQYSTNHLANNAQNWSRIIIDHQTDSSLQLINQTVLALAHNREVQYVREDVYKMLVLLEHNLIHALPGLQGLVEADANILQATSIESLLLNLQKHLVKLDGIAKNYRDKTKNSIVDQTMEYINTHFSQGISLDSIAKQMEISPYYLSKLLKRHTHKTCTELICERRIKEAKTLLKQNLSSKEVTFATGFNSQNYFTRVFKKYTGITPREYRNSHAAE